MSYIDYYSQIKKSFNKAAVNYNKNAVLQHEIATRLIERLEFFAIQPETLLDLGIGTGYITKDLLNIYPKANIIGLDFANNMLSIAKQENNIPLICGDINKLPIASNSIDIVFSNFTMQWCANITELFAECYRILKNNGLLIFSLPGPNSLQELKESMNTVDPEFEHVNNFIDMHDIGDILVQSKFAHPVMDNDHFTLTYKSVINILKELKSIGANTKLSTNYRKTLFGKYKFNQLYHSYEKFKQPDGRYPLTFEVIYGHAFKLDKPVKAKYPEISGIGEVAIPLDTIDKIIKK